MFSLYTRRSVVNGWMDEILANNLNYNRPSTQNPSFLGAAAYQRLSLSNPASAHGSPDRSLISSGMFSPPVTRRPPIAPRSGPLSIYNGAFSGQSSFGPGSLPTSSAAGGSFYYGHRTDDALTTSPAAARRANFNRMRQHRSLEGDTVPYFSADTSAGQSYFDSMPPADPQVPQSSYSQRYQISPRYSSQGNLGNSAFSAGTNIYGGGGGGGGSNVYQSGMLGGGGGQMHSTGLGTSGGGMYQPSMSGAGHFQSSNIGNPFQTSSSQSYQTNIGSGTGHYQTNVGSNYGASQYLGGGIGVSGGGPYSGALLTGMNPGPSNIGGGGGGIPMDGSSSFMASQPLSIATNPSSTYYNPFSNRDPYSMSLPILQREYELVRREYDSSMQKLNSCMNSIKTFWSPELKKERAMRKEEASKLALMQEQLKMASQENQVGHFSLLEN